MWRFLLKAAVSALLIWLLLRHRDLGAIAHQMLAVNPVDLVLAGVCFWVLALPSALRWIRILAAMGHELPLAAAFPIVLIGLFFNLVLPSSVGGDAVRMWKLHRLGLPGQVAVMSVMIDRLVALAALLLLVTAALPALYDLVADRGARNGVLVLLALGYVGFALAMLLEHLPASLKRHRLARWAGQLGSDLRRVLLVPRFAVPTLFYSLVNQGGLIVVTWILARGMGLPIGALDCLLVVPFAVLVSVIPISIAGWGLREGAFVAGFGLVGLGASQALALSVLYGLLNTAVNLPGGIIWLASADKRRPATAAIEPRNAGDAGA
jgi:uncharacterized membrane protein YbhN (UPF0104 family)